MSFLLPAGKARLQRVTEFYKFHTTVDVLRLDALHPVVSGNKWFKLQPYLQQAQQEGRDTLLSFGGAYSNHLLALAAAARLSGIKSIGLVRGERPAILSPTLEGALAEGMTLQFLTREQYRNKDGSALPPGLADHALVIPEGGYGPTGARGAAGILRQVEGQDYTHILAAVGTGTTMAGLVLAAGEAQVIGIPVLRNAGTIRQEINALLPAPLHERFRLFHDYHFGGYARLTPELTAFMNQWYEQTGIPSDFVYTGKAFYALNDLVARAVIGPGSRVLVIHTGGLQGNRSLPKGTLIFG